MLTFLHRWMPENEVKPRRETPDRIYALSAFDSARSLWIFRGRFAWAGLVVRKRKPKNSSRPLLRAGRNGGADSLSATPTLRLPSSYIEARKAIGKQRRNRLSGLKTTHKTLTIGRRGNPPHRSVLQNATVALHRSIITEGRESIVDLGVKVPGIAGIELAPTDLSPAKRVNVA